MFQADSLGEAVQAMPQSARVHVILPDKQAERFEAYCQTKGHKKSTLIARLIREHLDRERFDVQQKLFKDERR